MISLAAIDYDTIAQAQQKRDRLMLEYATMVATDAVFRGDPKDLIKTGFTEHEITRFGSMVRSGEYEKLAAKKLGLFEDADTALKQLKRHSDLVYHQRRYKGYSWTISPDSWRLIARFDVDPPAMVKSTLARNRFEYAFCDGEYTRLIDNNALREGEMMHNCIVALCNLEFIGESKAQRRQP